MNDLHLIEQALSLQGLPTYEYDIPHVSNILYTVKQAQAPLETFPYLNQYVPITLVDKRLIQCKN